LTFFSPVSSTREYTDPAQESTPIGLDRGAANTTMISPGKDESQMVDSRFGPADSAAKDSTLLSGLHGLSISNNKGVCGSALWGGGGDNDKGLPPVFGITEASDPKGPSPVYAAIQPTLAANEQHPPQSRFAWGGSSA